MTAALSYQERQELRVKVDRALREKHGLPTPKPGTAETPRRCEATAGPFALEARCRLTAEPGQRFCWLHGKDAT